MLKVTLLSLVLVGLGVLVAFLGFLAVIFLFIFEPWLTSRSAR
jgi:hypothetical protein